MLGKSGCRSQAEGALGTVPAVCHLPFKVGMIRSSVTSKKNAAKIVAIVANLQTRLHNCVDVIMDRYL